MARIRTIKPDAFTSESLSAVSVLARWTFAGLWTYFDDSGKGRADTRLIKAALFPLDDATTSDDVDAAVTELIDVGCVHTFMSGGRIYMHAPEFLRHQKINRPTKSTLPTCPCEMHDAPRSIHGSLTEEPNHGGLSEDSVRTQRGKGREGKGNGGEGEGSARKSATPTPTTRPPRNCNKHPEGTDDPCRACGDARKAHDSWQKPTLSAKTTMCGEHPKQRALNCPDCAAAAVRPPKGWRAS